MTHASGTDRSPKRPRLLTRATRAWLPKPTTPEHPPTVTPDTAPTPATTDSAEPDTAPTTPAEQPTAPTADFVEPAADPVVTVAPTADLVEPAADPTAPVAPTAPTDLAAVLTEPTGRPEAPARRPGMGARTGPRVVPPFVDPPSTAATLAGSATPAGPAVPAPTPTPEPGTEPTPASTDTPISTPTPRPRFAVVSLPEAPLRGEVRRRRALPSVRAVRLGGVGEPPPGPGGSAVPPAAVTPVPLPLPRAAGTTAVPNESRTEEPQP
ncbi:hypothetical protein ABZ621_35110 [Streptomyces sp. NPDC007863]|uniref:hypothetical protein n=1 Tax=Streptomyces sp. NPDC007863 TaxID=3154894 RepID=UPI0033EAD124